MVDAPHDGQLIEKILDGDEEAARSFRDRFLPSVRRIMLARCSDPRSREQAEEIAEDVFADCFGANGKKPLLELYSGRVSLSSWLTTVSMNRLKNWWRSGRRKFESPVSYLPVKDDTSQPDAIESAASHDAIAEDHEVAALLGEALLAAFRDVRPRDVVFLRLVHIFGFRRVDLASAWDVNPSTIGRAMDDGAALIRRNTLAYLKELDPALEISWEDCLAICARYPQVLLGEDMEESGDVVCGASEAPDSKEEDAKEEGDP